MIGMILVGRLVFIRFGCAFIGRLIFICSFCVRDSLFITILLAHYCLSCIFGSTKSSSYSINHIDLTFILEINFIHRIYDFAISSYHF